MKLYCYNIPPIDFWFGAITGKQLLETLWDRCWHDWDAFAAACKQVGELKTQAEVAFKTIGWEGDVREGPFYFALPGDNNLLIGYIVKQDNNGDCFIASPVPLPHLEGLALEVTKTI
jgi:hypothetical protein